MTPPMIIPANCVHPRSSRRTAGPYRLTGAHRQTAFTLIELVMCTLIAATLMMGIGSTMLVSVRALPQGDSASSATLTASPIVDQLAMELQNAVTINSRSATMVEFTVADRDGDEVVETLRWEWSGTAGDPLTRQYNGADPVALLEGVQALTLTYHVELLTEEITPQNESAETLLIGYEATENLYDPDVDYNEWLGQYFLPSLPHNALSWKVTRVGFYAKASGPPVQVAKVQLRLPTAQNQPSMTVLEEKTMYEHTLTGGFLLQEFNFSSVSGLSPDQGLCLVFTGSSYFDACLLRGQSAGAAMPESHLVFSANQSSSWSTYNDKALLFSIYGTVTTPGLPVIESAYLLKTVDIDLRPSTHDSSSIRTGVPILNQPRVME
ncbi:MAG: hypothetical protein IIC50_02925 [Planctomycetes bacterium]|nr:hypothetical protein [Planctomycetota bacterium]